MLKLRIRSLALTCRSKSTAVSAAPSFRWSSAIGGALKVGLVFGWIAGLFGVDAVSAEQSAVQRREFVSRSESPPRKVVIATVVARFAGSIDDRLALASRLVDASALDVSLKYPGKTLDLLVLPEFAFCREQGATAEEQAVTLEGDLLASLASYARRASTWLVVPMTLREENPKVRISNAAVLLNRNGRVSGIFRKVHPVADSRGIFEGGVTPGTSYPVFDCDFGRLGILICWDMVYEEGWDALAAGGAEIVALPSASPQTLRPMAQALRHHYYVVSSTPVNNASIFDPIGRTVAQVNRAPGTLVHQIDLSYAILHWSERLRGGEALRERFGASVGYDYSAREDTGIFWSNDPTVTIGTMIRELGLSEMPTEIQRIEIARKSAP
jgi:predicted amidohydrolase